MRAFVLTAPREFEVQDVRAPLPAPGGAVIDVERVGVCGTDVEFYTGEMQYLHEGYARFRSGSGTNGWGRLRRSATASIERGWDDG